MHVPQAYFYMSDVLLPCMFFLLMSHILQTLMNALIQLPIVCLMLTIPIPKVVMCVSVDLATMEMEGARGLDALVSHAITFNVSSRHHTICITCIYDTFFYRPMQAATVFVSMMVLATVLLENLYRYSSNADTTN